jgi:DNA-binding CsgD family transcriptional regulator
MKKHKPYSKRADLPANEIVSRYRAGESLAKIARAYGTSDNTVKRLLDQNGVQRRPAHEVFAKIPGKGPRGLAESLPAEQIISRYREGASLAELAKAYKVSVGTIRRVMDARGEERRSSAPRAGASRATSPETEAEIVRRSKQGQGLRVIADQLGISKNAVRKALDRQDSTPSNAPGFPRHDLPMEEIAKRRAAGKSARQLADEYGVSTSTINRRLKDMR